MLKFLSKNRRFIFFATIGVVALFAAAFFAPEAMAQVEENFAETGEAIRLPDTDIRVIIAKIIRAVILLVGIIFFSIVVYGGFLWMTSGGEATKIDKAKMVLRNGVIGLIITLASYSIAYFVLNALLNAGLLGRGSEPTVVVEPLSGSLGSGIIEDHWPRRNATDIPRNTKIIITFKEAMGVDSLTSELLEDVDGDPDTIEDNTWSLNAENVVIYANVDGEGGALTAEQVEVNATYDKLIWVFDPVDYIGSPDDETNYTVALKPGILLEDGSPAFDGAFDDGYEWGFQVSTELDVTPPYVTSVVPGDQTTRDRNIVVQINFNEAMDPTAVTGIHDVDDDREGYVDPDPNVDSPDFANVLVESSADQVDYDSVDGTWSISNGYKTVEFVTFDACGEDPCGDTIYCLPGDSYIHTTAKAATLGDEPPEAAGFPYDGAVDVVGNSLDGDHDETAEGPDTDNYVWEFLTTNEINDIVPSIYMITPDDAEGEVALDAPLEVTFMSSEDNDGDLVDDGATMMSSTLTTTNFGLAPDPYHTIWYVMDKEDLYAGYQDVQADPADEPVSTKAIMDHMTFLDSNEILQYYYPYVNEGVKSSYQICMFPSDGPGSVGFNINPPDCGVDTNNPSCCHKNAEGECTVPQPTE